MQQPTLHSVQVTCECGHTFVMQSTLDQETLAIEICSKCHPFYTGEQKIIDSAGNVERFYKKFGKPKQG